MVCISWAQHSRGNNMTPPRDGLAGLDPGVRFDLPANVLGCTLTEVLSGSAKHGTASRKQLLHWGKGEVSMCGFWVHTGGVAGHCYKGAPSVLGGGSQFLHSNTRGLSWGACYSLLNSTSSWSSGELACHCPCPLLQSLSPLPQSLALWPLSLSLVRSCSASLLWLSHLAKSH